MADEKTASELIEYLKTANQEEAQAVLNAELDRSEDQQRVTVIRAATDRLDVLAVPGEPLTGSEPTGLWAQLLDEDGNPVTVDGQPVQAELVS